MCSSSKTVFGTVFMRFFKSSSPSSITKNRWLKFSSLIIRVSSFSEPSEQGSDTLEFIFYFTQSSEFLLLNLSSEFVVVFLDYISLASVHSFSSLALVSLNFAKVQPGMIISTIYEVNILDSISSSFRMIFISRYNYLAVQALSKGSLISFMAKYFPVLIHFALWTTPQLPSPNFSFILYP